MGGSLPNVNAVCTSVAPATASISNSLTKTAASTVVTYTLKDLVAWTLTPAACGAEDTLTLTNSATNAVALAASPYATATFDVDRNTAQKVTYHLDLALDTADTARASWTVIVCGLETLSLASSSAQVYTLTLSDTATTVAKTTYENWFSADFTNSDAATCVVSTYSVTSDAAGTTVADTAKIQMTGTNIVITRTAVFTETTVYLFAQTAGLVSAAK